MDKVSVVLQTGMEGKDAGSAFIARAASNENHQSAVLISSTASPRSHAARQRTNELRS